MFIKIVNRRDSLFRPFTREFPISVRDVLHIELGDWYVFLADGSSLIFDVVVTFWRESELEILVRFVTVQCSLIVERKKYLFQLDVLVLYLDQLFC